MKFYSYSYIRLSWLFIDLPMNFNTINPLQYEEFANSLLNCMKWQIPATYHYCRAKYIPAYISLGVWRHWRMRCYCGLYECRGERMNNNKTQQICCEIPLSPPRRWVSLSKCQHPANAGIGATKSITNGGSFSIFFSFSLLSNMLIDNSNVRKWFHRIYTFAHKHTLIGRTIECTE